jgi:hypothetical protein
VNLRFDQPGLLWLALLLVPLIVASWRALVTQDRFRRSVVLLLRSALLLALVVCLAGPRLEREHHHVTVIGVLDLSGSVKQFAQLPEAADEAASLSAVEYLRNWFRQATRTKAPDDRFGLVVFDGKATVVSVPVKGDYVDDNLDVTIFEGTNIAEARRPDASSWSPTATRPPGAPWRRPERRARASPATAPGSACRSTWCPSSTRCAATCSWRGWRCRRPRRAARR